MSVTSHTVIVRATLAGIVAVTLAACTDAETNTPEMSPPPAPASAEPTPRDGEEHLGDYEGIEEDSYDGPHTPSADSQAQALDRATDALVAFYDTDQTERDWFKQLHPYLSATARVAYETVDPTRVEPSPLTGDPQVVRFDGGGGITVAVPTEAGNVTVDLVIEDAGQPWTVERFHFPETDD